MSYSITLQEFSQVPSEKPLTQPQMKLANKQVQEYLESVVNPQFDVFKLCGFSYDCLDYRICTKKINQFEYGAAREEWLEEEKKAENVAQVMLGYAEITKSLTTTGAEKRHYYAVCYKRFKNF